MLKNNDTSILQILKKDIDTHLLKRLILFALLFGTIVHGFNFFNADYASDGLGAMYQRVDISWKIKLGRFMQAVSIWLRGYHNNTVINGIISLVLIALSTYILLKTFHITQRISYYLLCALFITSAPYIETNIYFTHELDAFMLALLFATMASYVYTRFERGYLLAPLFIAISCGFYQAYISITIVSFMLMIIIEILRGEKSHKQIIRSSIKSLATLSVGGILYFACYKIINLIANNGEVIDFYNSVDNMFSVGDDLFGNLYKVYRLFVINVLFYCQRFRMIPNAIIGFTFASYIMVSIIAFIRKNRPSKINILLLCIILLLIPLGAYFASFLFGSYSCWRMLIGSLMLYVTVLMLLEYKSESRKIRYTTYAAMTILIFNGAIWVNSAYIERSIEVKTTYEIMYKLNSDLTTHPDYKPNNQRVIHVHGDLYSLPQLSHSKYFTKVISFNDLIQCYLRYYFNTHNLFIYGDIAGENIEMRQKIDNMPCYPHDGYIELIGDVLVVKFPTEKPQL